MKRSVILFMILATASCDNRYDPWERDNLPPEIGVLGKNIWNSGSTIWMQEINDSAKVGFAYRYQVLLKDERSKMDLIIESPGGVINDKNNKKVGFSVEIDEPKSINKTLEHSYTPSSSGQKTVRYFCQDGFGKIGEAAINLTSFINLKPGASFNINPLQVVDPYEYELDGSESMDKDEKFGGKIVMYHWQINDNQGNIDYEYSPAPKLNYIFLSPSVPVTYTITLTVEDNNGSLSTPLNKNFTLNP